MKSKSVFSKKLLGVVIILSTTLLSCVINDTNDDSTPSVMDTTATKLDNPPATSTQSSMSDNPANTVVATGKAIPNPAKKGMKGKVTVIETATSKPVANMEADVNGIYSNVEIIPSFPGGYKGLQKFFDDNLEYPADATNDGVEGTVSVSFVVDETGKLTSPKVDGDNLGYGLEAEALRVVNKMPSWNPGKLKGKNVKTKFILPVKFVLY